MDNTLGQDEGHVENTQVTDSNPQKPSDSKIEEWKKVHGEIFEVMAGDDIYYFRGPTRPEFKMYFDSLIDSRYDAHMRLLSGCMLYPPIHEYQAKVEKKPALVAVMSSKTEEIFGTNVDVSVKKM